MTDEYYLAVSHFNLSWDELVQLGRNSLEFAYLTDVEKADRLDSYDHALNDFASSFSASNWKNRLSQVEAETYDYAKRYFDISF